MIVVLHSAEDLTPITVINLAPEAWEALEKDKAIKLNLDADDKDNVVNIFKVPFSYEKKSLGHFYVASPDDLALSLMPSLLPGQHLYQSVIDKLRQK